MKKPHVLVLGDINIDAIVNADRYPAEGGEAVAQVADFRPGGSGCNTSVVLAKLGTEVWHWGNLGTDPLGQMSLNFIQQSGMHSDLIQIREEHQSGFFIILVTPGGQRTMFGSRGCNAKPLRQAGVTEILKEIDWVHISGYMLIADETWQAANWLIQEAKKLKIPISLDPGMCTIHTVYERIEELLPDLDYLMISRDELRELGGGRPESDVLKGFFTHRVRNVILKMGADGSRFIQPDRQIDQPAIHRSNEKIYDTTGAGDCFDAGFIFGTLNSSSVEECLALGNLAAYQMITSPHGMADVCQVEKLETNLNS